MHLIIKAYKTNCPQFKMVSSICYYGNYFFGHFLFTATAVGTVALVETISTEHFVNARANNTSQIQNTQLRIDSWFMSELAATKNTIMWLREQIESLLLCHQNTSKYYVTPFKYNSSVRS